MNHANDIEDTIDIRNTSNTIQNTGSDLRDASDMNDVMKLETSKRSDNNNSGDRRLK